MIREIRLRRLDDGNALVARRRDAGTPLRLPVLTEADVLRRFAVASTPTVAATSTRDLALIGVVSAAPFIVETVVRWVA